MTAPTRVPCSYPECGGGCAECQPEPQQTPRPSWVDGGGDLSGAEGYQGPKKFTAEEIADGCVGLRFVTATHVAGRPTSHDVMEYLKARGADAYCSCADCKAFFGVIPPAPNQGEAS